VSAPHLAGSYLVVETTNTCSLACVHCAVSEPGHPHHARTGFLPLALAEKLFVDLASAGARFDTLIPFWLGEPLVHPEFGAFYQLALRAAAEHGTFGAIEVHTNATHLTAERVRIALNASAVPQTWHLTLDAATRGTYRAIKGVDRFDAVCRNVDGFLAAKAARAARWPRVVLQFIVSDRNAAEVPGFRAHWEARCRALGLAVRASAQEVPAGDDVVLFFRQLDCPTLSEQAAQNGVFRDVMAREGLRLARPTQSPASVEGPNTTVCGCFWKSPVVGWDGRVTTCTRDNRFENAVGSLVDHSFAELWWGATMRERRAAVARADYAALPACQDCFIPRSANYAAVTPAEIEAHARA
jgi:radical SAM protein with 4Fe4S-binding SPASM domain